ncbi:MAG: DUF177 domain-containing protein [Oscillospiraceae bacterium]|jgi:uncharacterized protein|nr:DUF177 domain-containing protein [Oscillospiraceae bacterium]
MLMKIKNVLNIPGTSMEASFSIPEDRLEQVHGYVFSTPVNVEGKIENRAGVVTLTMHIAFSLLVTCDRCLKETVQDFAYDTTHTVVRELQSEDEEEHYVVAKAESIDAAEIAISDLLLELPSKLLCREDCKGLCPVCGCDRNENDCDCMSE